MAVAMKSNAAKNRATTGPTGPRTSQGKINSSRNSGKHLIFSGRVLGEEKKEVIFLTRALQEQLRPHGVLEYEMIDDLVLNRIRKYRIENYETRQFGRATLHVAKHRYEQDEQRQAQAWLRAALSGDEALETWFDRLPPNHCVPFLRTLKEMIENRGPHPDEDSKLLRFIYKKQFSELGAKMMSLCTDLKCTRENEKDEKQLKLIDQKYRRLLLEIVEAEIKFQGNQIEFETIWEDVEFPLGVVMFPEDSIMDRIERYRTSNAREYNRLLENLEIIRRLSDQT
jgi:hypothetical protein